VGDVDAACSIFSLYESALLWLNGSPLHRQAELDEALLRVNALGPLWMTEAMLPLLRSVSCPLTAASVHFLLQTLRSRQHRHYSRLGRRLYERCVPGVHGGPSTPLVAFSVGFTVDHIRHRI
jgi:hypothetical protein